MGIDVHEILHTELFEAMEQRSKVPYSEENGFRMSVKAYNPFSGKFFMLPLSWRSHAEKQDVMAKASLIAHYAAMPALIVATDTRWVESTKFADHFQLPKPDGQPESVDAYYREFRRIVKAHDGDFARLPRSVWHEAILVWIKGPETGTHVLSSTYERGDLDSVRWLETFNEAPNPIVNLIPDYWLPGFADDFVLPPESRAVFEAVGAELKARAAR